MAWIKGFIRSSVAFAKTVSLIASENELEYKTWLRMTLIKNCWSGEWKLLREFSLVRDSFKARVKLQVTFICLTTGNIYRSVSYFFWVSQCIPEVSDAISEAFKDSIKDVIIYRSNLNFNKIYSSVLQCFRSNKKKFNATNKYIKIYNCSSSSEKARWYLNFINVVDFFEVTSIFIFG